MNDLLGNLQNVLTWNKIRNIHTQIKIHIFSLSQISFVPM